MKQPNGLQKGEGKKRNMPGKFQWNFQRKQQVSNSLTIL